MSNYTVLIVEDNERNLMVIRDLMQVHGHRTIEAEDGPIAIQMAREHRPDLILLDIQLPTMDGYEVTRRLKADDMTKWIPIIAVTSFAMKGEEEKALDAGCDAYTSKPIDIHKLVELVRKFLPEKEPGTSQASGPKVLIVDDEPRNLLVLEGILAPLHYDLRKAENGPEELDNSRISANHVARTLATEDTTSHDWTASSANGAAGYLGVSALSLGGYTDVTVVIRDSSDDAVFVDLITFVNVSAAPNAQRVTVAGTVDRYTLTRHTFNGAGSSQTITFATGLGRI